MSPNSRSRALRVAACLLAGLCALPARTARADGGTLGSGSYRLIGASFDVTPTTQTVPIGVSAVVKTVFSGPVANLAQGGARVQADLTGPSVPGTVTLTTTPGGSFVLPVLSVKGDYRLANIRLTDSSGSSVPALHPTAVVTVTDLLISSITSRALTSAELAARGIVVNDKDFKAYSFALGLAIQGKTITVDIPTIVKSNDTYVPIGPPVVKIDNPDERFTAPTILVVPMKKSADPANPDIPDIKIDEDGAGTPVFGILVFPGNIRFLNQFFSVMLMVQNGSAPGSGLSLRDVTTTVSVPASALRVVKTTPSVADGQPIPVRGPGPDGVLGTGDDLVVLAAQDLGQAEFVTEGLKVGTHEVVCAIDAFVDGVAGHPGLQMHGQARGSVLVRDPSFALTFNHPDVIRAGEPYELRVTVVNTSTVDAKKVSISIDAHSITGATSDDVGEGIDPVASLGDISPGAAANAVFHFHATKTGRVVASSFTSDGDMVGALRLRAGVTNDGTPLSPDSFVFPRFMSVLPAGVVDPATALIGIAHGLATIDPTAPGNEMLPPFADGVVQERVVDLVEAARRATLGEPIPSAVAELALGWLGIAANVPAFDGVRRVNNHGVDMEAGIGAVLAGQLQGSGRDPLLQNLIDSALAVGPPFDPNAPFAGPVFALLEAGSAGNPAARLALVDQQTGVEIAGQPGEAEYKRDLPFASLYTLGSAELAVLGRPGAMGVNILLRGKRTGTAVLTIVYPDGQGGFRSVRFDPVATAAASLGGTLLNVANPGVELGSSVEPFRTLTATPFAATPFAAIAAVQDLDVNPIGKGITLLFNRRVPRSAEDARLYALPAPGPDGVTRDRPINNVNVPDDLRRVIVLAESVICPFPGRSGAITGTSVPSQSGESWTGSLPIVAQLQMAGGSVQGRVLGPDGTPVADTQVQLTERSVDDISGESFAGGTSTVKTDAHGAFFIDFVRKQDGFPFRLDSYDPVTGSKGYAVGSIHTNGEVVQIDVALQGRGTVRGAVVDGGGHPLAGVIVRCAATTDPSFRTAQYSQADGSFAFTSVPVGTVQLEAEDPTTNRIAFATAVLGAPGATTSAQLVLTFLAHTSLALHVVHGADGSVYPGLYVAGYSVVAGQQDQYFGVRVTDAQGAASFASAPATDVRLEVFNGISQYPILVQSLHLTQDTPADATLVIVETTPRYGSASGTVSQIVNGVTTPVASAIVYQPGSGLRATTGSDGTWRLDNIAIGEASLVALLPASGRTTSHSVTVQEGSVSTVDFLFTDNALGTVTGTVVDQNGQPRAGASVQIWDFGPPPTVITSTTTAADGTFVLMNVPVGTSTLQATSTETLGGKSVRNAGLQTVTIPGPGGRAVASIALRGWVSVTGRVIARVRDKNGILHDNPVFSPVVVSAPHFYGQQPGDTAPDPTNPEYGAMFLDNPPGGVPAAKLSTDPPTGTFTVEGLHGGHITVTAVNPFYQNKTVDLGFVLGDTAKGPFDIVFDGNMGVVDGVLYNADGSPIPNAPLTMELASPGWGAPVFDPLQAVTHADGTFTFPLVPFGYGLHAVFNGDVSGIHRFAEAYGSIQQTAPSVHLTLRALPVGTVDVTVVKPSANGPVPVVGAGVRVDELNGPRRSFTDATNTLGKVTFTGITGGPIAALAKEDMLSGRIPLVGVGDGFHVSGTVTLTGTGSLTGTVKSPADGSGVAGVNVILLQSPGSNWEVQVGVATTDSSGGYAIPDVPVPAGAVYALKAEDPRTLRRGASPSFSLTVGQALVQDITLRPIGAVAGTMTTFDGATPIPGADIRISSWDAQNGPSPDVHVSTGPDGSYRADGVLAGLVTATAFDPLTRLSATGSGLLSSEGQVVTVDLRATPTGRVVGSALWSDGTALPAAALAPQVTLSGGNGQQVALAKDFVFEDVVSTQPFRVDTAERVEPFHLGTTTGQAVAGADTRADVRFGPLGKIHVLGRKPDPLNPGHLIPIAGHAAVYSAGPYRYRFPSGSSINLDGSGEALFLNVGGGFGVSVTVWDDTTGDYGSATVPDFAENQTVDITVVTAQRGIVRGRFLLPAPNDTQPAGLVNVTLSRNDVGGGVLANGVTASDGTFEIHDVEIAKIAALGVLTSGAPGSAVKTGTLTTAAPVLDLGDIVLDGVPPQVIATDPANGATGLGLAPTFRFTFSEPIWGIDGSLVHLYGPTGEQGAGGLSLDATRTILTVSPGTLTGATAYELRLSSGIRDRAFLAMGADYVLRFTVADLTAPTVRSSQPVPEQIQVPLAMNPTVVMTKAIDPASLAGGVHLNRLDSPAGSLPVAPALQSDGKTISVNPVALPSPEGEYEVVLDAIRDTAGNALPSPVHIHFFTVDGVAPVVAIDPPDSATPVEGSRHTYTVRWADHDVKTVTLFLVASTGYLRYDGDTSFPARVTARGASTSRCPRSLRPPGRPSGSTPRLRTSAETSRRPSRSPSRSSRTTRRPSRRPRWRERRRFVPGPASRSSSRRRTTSPSRASTRPFPRA